MPKDYTPNLHLANELAISLKRSIKDVDISRLIFRAPVIDRQAESSGGWRQDEIQGFRKWVENVNHHHAGIEAMIGSGVPPKEDPLPNIQGYLTFWKQVLISRPPIAAIKTSMKGKGKEETFVDIISRGGEEWIRIYSKKVSQLLSEFREQDSYLNSDSDSDYEGESSSGPRDRKPLQLNNSVLTAADVLLSVAKNAERIPGASPPRITMRFSRIEEHPSSGRHDDPRVNETFKILRERGINVVFGDLSELDLQDLTDRTKHLESATLLPSIKINLDPTSLMGLCSDLLHYPLPADEQGAKDRYLRPREFLLNGNGERQADSVDEDELTGQSQNSRELVRGTLEEIEHPLIGEIRDTLALAVDNHSHMSEDSTEVEFWATKEAIQFVKETMSSGEVIGEGLEQRRMRRLIGLEDGDFWEGSRWEGREGVLKGLRIRVFEGNLPQAVGEPAPMCQQGMSSFQKSMRAITSEFLDEWYAFTSTPRLSAPRPPFPAEIFTPRSQPGSHLPSFLQPRRLPTPKVVNLSLPFTVVSLHSYLRGAAEGMTTLSMGNVVFRDLFAQPRWKVRGWVQGSYEHESGQSGDDGQRGTNRRAHATAWILPYRTLGEGKRVKFANGDYSYPRV